MHWPLWAADREGDEHAGGGSGVLVGPPPRKGRTYAGLGRGRNAVSVRAEDSSTGSLWLSWVRASCALCLPVFEYGLFALDRAGDLGPKASRQWRPFHRARS